MIASTTTTTTMQYQQQQQHSHNHISLKRRALDHGDDREAKRARAPEEEEEEEIATPIKSLSRPSGNGGAVPPLPKKERREYASTTVPQDVVVLRRRIEQRATDFSGLEHCPWAQTNCAMRLAVEVGGDDPVGSTNYAVRWLIRMGNPYWFTLGLRSAVQSHKHALMHELIADASLWLTELRRSSSSSSSNDRDGASAATANSHVHRELRRAAVESRKRSVLWGPFSSDYYGPDADARDEEEEEEEEEEAAPNPAAQCFHDSKLHAPSILMLDALLHGNQEAAECVARAFVPSSWRLVGSWSIDNYSYSSQDAAAAGRTAFVPTTIIRLGKKRIHATGYVDSPRLGALMDQVRQCLRAMQRHYLPALVEEESDVVRL